MAVYLTTKCPYCGYILKYRTGYPKELIGSPFETCPSCKRQYKTGKNFWKNMDIGDRIWYILRSILLFPFALFIGTIFISIIFLLIIAIFGIDIESIDNQLYLYSVLSIVGILYIFNIINNIKYDDRVLDDQESNHTSP